MTTRTIETGTDDLLAAVTDGVATITMNRPDRRNAMSGSMIGGLKLALADAESSRDVRAVVLTGAGSAFCAGGDVKGFAEGAARSDGEGSTFDEMVHRQRIDQRATSGALYQMPKPTIAALGGPAAGAGLSLALACDLRIAVDSTVITTAFAKVGFSGDFGGSWFLARLIGQAKAKQLYYLSDRVDMPTALELGIVNWAVPADRFDEEVQSLATRLASGPTIAYRYMKENINRAMDGELIEAMDLEVTHHLHCGGTEDHVEASKAFVEKRDPVFHGR